MTARLRLRKHLWGSVALFSLFILAFLFLVSRLGFNETVAAHIAWVNKVSSCPRPELEEYARNLHTIVVEQQFSMRGVLIGALGMAVVGLSSSAYLLSVARSQSSLPEQSAEPHATPADRSS